MRRERGFACVVLTGVIALLVLCLRALVDYCVDDGLGNLGGSEFARVATQEVETGSKPESWEARYQQSEQDNMFEEKFLEWFEYTVIDDARSLLLWPLFGSQQTSREMPFEQESSLFLNSENPSGRPNSDLETAEKSLFGTAVILDLPLVGTAD